MGEAHPLHGVSPDKMDRAKKAAKEAYSQMLALGMTRDAALEVAIGVAAAVIHPHGFVLTIKEG